MTVYKNSLPNIRSSVHANDIRALALTGLTLNTLFQFVYFCTSVYFKTSEKKTPIDPDKISVEYFQVYKQAVFALNFQLTSV